MCKSGEKIDIAVSWFRQRLIRKVFNKYSHVVAKIIVEKHQNQNSEENKTVQSGKFPGLFTHDEIKNPTAWNKSRSEVEPLASPKFGAHVTVAGNEDISDDILKTAAQISEEMQHKLLQEQKLKEEKKA